MEAGIESELLFFRTLDTASPPTRQTAGAAGYDLTSAFDYDLPAGERRLCETGIGIVLPPGCYGRCASRSGMALNSGIEVGAGVIDPDYRGTIKVLLYNHGRTAYKISAGDRIAQLILEKMFTLKTKEIFGRSFLPVTPRGVAGFGSTDK